jgi:hypothetical protein
MENGKFIGAIDLSVRLSSMNPLSYIDINEAATKFERVILLSCLHTFRNSESRHLLTERGVVRQGSGERRFEIERFDDFLRFIKWARHELLDQKLPFKLCARGNATGGKILSERWSHVIDEFHSGETSTNRKEQLRRILLENLGTSDSSEIQTLFSLYRADSSYDASALLEAEIESFKGFGFHAPIAFIDQLDNEASKHFFENCFPIKTGKGLEIRRFIDLKYDIDDSDLVTILESGPNILSTGVKNLIDNVFELLRRSMKADEANGIYYISIINGFVLSSNFSELVYISKEKRFETTTSDGLEAQNPVEQDLKEGWQWYPVIFGALIIDTTLINTIKKAAGCEIVLATLINKVLSLKFYGGVISTIDEFAVTILIKTIERKYGENIIRRIINLPEFVISSVTRKFVLKAASDI